MTISSTDTSSRRSFLKAAAAPMIVPASVFGANAPSNRVQLAAFGVGGRGSADTNGINAHPDARFVAVCDCYEDRRERKRQEWNKRYGGDYVKSYANPWDVLKRSDIDAVVIATPDHWHAPLAIAAIRAGKDIYVEKPLSVAMKWSWRLRDEMKGKAASFSTARNNAPTRISATPANWRAMAISASCNASTPGVPTRRSSGMCLPESPRSRCTAMVRCGPCPYRQDSISISGAAVAVASIHGRPLHLVRRIPHPRLRTGLHRRLGSASARHRAVGHGCRQRRPRVLRRRWNAARIRPARYG